MQTFFSRSPWERASVTPLRGPTLGQTSPNCEPTPEGGQRCADGTYYPPGCKPGSGSGIPASAPTPGANVPLIIGGVAAAAAAGYLLLSGHRHRMAAPTALETSYPEAVSQLTSIADKINTERSNDAYFFSKYIEASKRRQDLVVAEGNAEKVLAQQEKIWNDTHRNPDEYKAAQAKTDAAKTDATKTESGLAWKVLRKGKGTESPGPHDKVSVAFTGWTPEGQVIASSIPDGEPWALAMDSALPGLAEGLRLMTTGEKRRLWIPAPLAASGSPKRHGPAGPAVFDVELVSFVKMPGPITVPEDVDAPPADAKRTASGLAYKILKRGKGKQHPTAASTVEVHYSGWTPDGKLFDSSVKRGKPTSFPLNGVIKGWTEGVQLMVVGDKARFWIPGALAYGDKPSKDGGPPGGPLVFDIELLAIK